MTDAEPIICLFGPTAAGKTDLAIALSKAFPCDIISVDSAMVYREMNIGSAKPEAEILALAPHRLIDIRDPADAYSAADFCHDAKIEIEKSHHAGRIPLLVGGTMLYYRALLQGLNELPAADPKVRERLIIELEEEGLPALYERLQTVDLASSQRIHANDSQRIQRALEVYELTGKPMTELLQQETVANYPHALLLGLMPAQRDILHARIEQRFLAMLDNGFVDEVQALLSRGDLTLDMPSMRAVGYRQVCEHLNGSYDEKELIARGVAATRQLAKRQLTWLRNWPGVKFLDSLQADTYQSLHQHVVTYIKNWQV